MAITKSDIPQLLLPGLKAEFDQAFRTQADHSLPEQLATVINTTLPVQNYAWLGATPPMREFQDERQPVGINSYSMSIADKVFEASIAVDRKAIEDDQLDLIRLRVRDLAIRVGTHRTQLIIEQLIKGFSASGVDGTAFFALNHPNQGSSYSNLMAAPLSETSLADAIGQMMLLPDDTGNPLGISPDTLLVGPKNQWLAMELVQSPVVVYKGNGADTAASTPYANVFYGRLKVLVTPYISGADEDKWFIADTKRPMRGVILQQRSDVPVEFTALDGGTDSEAAWMRDRYYYGVRGRYNVGFGMWQTVLGGTG